MAAVIRVKRRINEEPLNAFVLNCKRRKIENTDSLSSNDETSTIMKFAGTVNTQDDQITSQLYKITKEKAESIITKIRKPDIQLKSREDIKKNTMNSRFKIVNCSRPIELKASDENENKQITVVDIEKQLTDEQIPCTSNSIIPSETAINDKEDKYVYDLYLTDSGGPDNNIHENLIDNLLSIRPFEDLMYGSHRDNGLSNNSSDSEDSDDSNDENNWRNEYPSDSEREDDDGNSIGELDIRRAVEDLNMDEDLLSSDDETAYRNGFVYSIDPESIAFEDDIDCCDVNRYGEAYARYKARVINKTTTNEYNYDADDDDRCSDLDELDNYE